MLLAALVPMEQNLGMVISQIGTPFHTVLTVLGLALFCAIIQLCRRLHP